MNLPITMQLASAGGAPMAQYRRRTRPGAYPLPDSTPMAAENAGADDDRQFAPSDEPRTAVNAELAGSGAGSMFAAAVIAGALPATAQTMEELIQRIGLSTTPDDSQARLKDLLA